jgi:uncharacterized protein YbcV (DUF1398 family)
VGETLAGRIAFPEVVQRMLESGVERYEVDLARLEIRHYAGDGASHLMPLPIEAPPAAREFSARGVSEAIGCAQRGEVKYVEFLEKILAAGTVGYGAYLTGRKVVYYGREGDCHVEPFPAAR